MEPESEIVLTEETRLIIEAYLSKRKKNTVKRVLKATPYVKDSFEYDIDTKRLKKIL